MLTVNGQVGSSDNAQISSQLSNFGHSLVTPLSTTITPSWSLDYATPSSGWSSLLPSYWLRSSFQILTVQFQYTAYNSPPNWDEWSCNYADWNALNAQGSGTTYCNYQQIMKGTINGATQVFTVLVDTQTVQSVGAVWTFTAYYELNSGGNQYLGQWTATTTKFLFVSSILENV